MTDTEARIALAAGDPTHALTLAAEAIALAERTANAKATIDSLVTMARA